MVLCSAMCLLLGSLGCTDSPTGTANQPPHALASQDTIVLPYSLVELRGDGVDQDGTIESYEWLFEGERSFVAVSTGDTAVLAPPVFDTDYVCILRVTDNEGAVALDTVHVIVSWLESPHGGEIYHIGDTVEVNLLPVEILVTLKLIVYRDGDYAEFGLPGLTGNVWPPVQRAVSFVVPDSLTDGVFGRMSLVSDSCRIRVVEYNAPTNYTESVGCFAIAP